MTQAERISALREIWRKVADLDIQIDALEAEEEMLRAGCTHTNADGSNALDDSCAYAVCKICGWSNAF